jgi:hypothetical protein
MKDAIWVFRSFGFIAGIIYVKDSFLRLFRKKSKKANMFEDLTDEQARNVAWAFGIYRWTDREDLNRQWNDFEQRMNTLH